MHASGNKFERIRETEPWRNSLEKLLGVLVISVEIDQERRVSGMEPAFPTSKVDRDRRPWRLEFDPQIPHYYRLPFFDLVCRSSKEEN